MRLKQGALTSCALGCLALRNIADLAPAHNAGNGWAVMLAGHLVQAPSLVAPVVDPGIMASLGQRLICGLGPARPPAFQHGDRVPLPGLLSEAVPLDPAHGQHHMSVEILVVFPAPWCVKAHISDHSMLNKIPLHIPVNEVKPLPAR